MPLSNDLISRFVKITNDGKKTKNETVVYGTISTDKSDVYVTIDGADYSNIGGATGSHNPKVLVTNKSVTEVKNGDRVTVLIKNHTAIITGNIDDPSTNKGYTDTSVGAVAERLTNLEKDAVRTSELDAKVAYIEKAIIDKVDAKYIDTDELSANNATFKEALVEELDAKYINVDELNVDELNASVGKISELESDNIKINEQLTAHAGVIENLDSKYATIERMKAAEAVIDDLDATYAKITELEAAEGRIDILESDVATIDNIIFKGATGDTIHTNFSNSVVAQLGDAQIKSAMIYDVSANKISAGTLSTNKVTIASDDGAMKITDGTIQILDGADVRIQIGKDANGNYSIIICDADGNTMLDADGLTENGIKDAIIRNDMVSETANIAASKLNIDSLFEVINNSSNTIKSTQIYVDDAAQTLSVAFKSLTSTVNDISTDVGNLQNDVGELQNDVSSQGTQITAIQGQISSKVWQQDIDSATDTMSTQYSELQQEVDGISATVVNHTTQIGEKADNSTVTTINNKVTSIESDLSGFKTTVSATYTTKTEFNNLEIGGRNLVRDSRMDADTDLWGLDHNHHTISFTNGYIEIVREYDANYTSRTFNNQDSGINPLLMPDKISGETYVLQAELKAVEGIASSAQSSLFWRVYYDDSTSYEEITLYFPNDLSSTEWRRCYVVKTFGTQNWTSSQLTIALANLDNGICVRNIMLEKATKPSAWSPAPEDFEAEISNAEAKIVQNADSITQIVSRTSANESAIASLELTADGLTAKVDASKKQKYHETSGTSGVAGYVGVCTFKITGAYTNRPIIFALTNRGQQSSNVSVCFINANSTDPSLHYIHSDGGMNVWMRKTGTSTWELIVQKSESYDTIYVNDFTNMNAGITVTWTSVHYTELPTDNIVAATRLAAKLTKETVDNAAKTATNYLNFSTSGLVVGDMTASTLGKNVLIDSDSVDIRNGTSTLASFGADTIYLGKNSSTAVINLCNSSAIMKVVDDVDFKIYTDKRLVMAAYDTMLLDCWRDGTHMTRIGMQSADPDDETQWGGVSLRVHQDSVVNVFEISNNTLESRITDGTNTSRINFNETTFKVNAADKIYLTATNGIQVSGNIVMPNAKPIYMKGANGTEYDVIRMGGDTSAPLLIVGDGLYNAGIGQTNINAGSSVQLLVPSERIVLQNVGSSTYSAYFRPNTNGTCTLGTSGNKWYAVYASNGTIQTSDAREKENIIPLKVTDDVHSALFDRLQPVQYNFINGNKKTCYGLIAQQVISVMEELGIEENELDLVHHDFWADEETGVETDTYGLSYNNLIALLIHEVQKLKGVIQNGN